MAARNHSCVLYSVIATISKQRGFLGMNYSILVGAPGSRYEAPNHWCKQRVTWVRTDLVSNLILWMRKLREQKIAADDFTLCKGCDLAPGTSRKAAVDPSMYPLFCGIRVSPVHEVNSSLDHCQPIISELEWHQRTSETEP